MAWLIYLPIYRGMWLLISPIVAPLYEAAKFGLVLPGTHFRSAWSTPWSWPSTPSRRPTCTRNCCSYPQGGGREAFPICPTSNSEYTNLIDQKSREGRSS